MLAHYVPAQQPHLRRHRYRHHPPDIIVAQPLLQQQQQQHRQTLEHFISFQQEPQSPSLPSQDYLATPLTPALSQSLSFASPSSTASACASPTYSSPAFSAQNSPSTSATFSSFLTGTGSQSMQDRGFPPQAPAELSHTPPIRVHHSTPPFGGQSLAEDNSSSSMLLQSGLPLDNSWENLVSPAKFSQRSQNGSSPTRQLGFYNNQYKRASPGSSGVSAPSTGPVSPLHPSVSSFSPSSNGGYEGTNQSTSSTKTKPLPTPEHTPVHSSFLAAPFQTYDPSSRDGDHTEVEMAMRRAVLEQQKQQQQLQQQQAIVDDEVPYTYSLAPSVSTLSHDSPATPHTSYPDDFDDGSKTIPHDFSGHGNPQMGVPRLNRTMSDICQDELYNPPVPILSPVRRVPSKNSKLFSPYRNVIADRLQAAHQGHMSSRSDSPASSLTREQSPFRQGSPYAQSPSYHNPHSQQSSHLNSEIQLAAQPQPDMAGMDLRQRAGEPKTISPKDAILEYHESPDEEGMPLFPPQHNGGQYHVPTQMGGPQNFQHESNFPSMDAFSNQYGHAGNEIPQQYSYMQQSQQPQPHLSLQVQNQQHVHPNQHHQERRENNMVHRNPEFPAHLPSMESTNSENHKTRGATSPTGQIQRTTSRPSEPTRRPDDTTSDSGTYSCTYHGCTLRFETPAKLQKHKREAHRQTTPGSHGGVRDSPAGANALAMRNSQAGPHKCERINPSTGKPCNSIFSRPYDLTRHEDTIHNARKQKVRCHLCTEEKTFSRNDALTRHMRVVHPEIDWPGKQKRKGRD